MRLDQSTMERWQGQRRLAPKARLRPLDVYLDQSSLPPSVNLVLDISTLGSLRDQGANGNCWIWASSALAEVALMENYGLRDSLSVQYVDSLISSKDWGSGGSLADYCAYINAPGILVPWNNANAAYLDGLVTEGLGQSLTPTSTIQLSPAYSHVTGTPNNVPTYQVGQATAIANIKGLLAQHQPVGFSFFCNFSGPSGFDAWWNGNPETSLWPEPISGPTDTPDDGFWGGHMVVLVGYDETDPLPANHYWIVLNSWGTSANRPSGLFRMPMAMNYDARFTLGGTSSQNYVFETLKLVVDHPTATVPTLNVAASSTQGLLGQPLTFTVTPQGYPPFSYQWRADGQLIEGALSASFTIPYLHSTDGGTSYDVVVGNTVNRVPVQTVGLAQVVPGMTGQTQVLQDPGFEATSGPSAWTLTALSGTHGGSLENATNQAHSGDWDALLGEASSPSCQGTLDQIFTVPSGPGAVLLSYWNRGFIHGYFNSGQGGLSASILDAGTGNLIWRIDERQIFQDPLTWTQTKFGLTDLKGRTVKLQFSFWTQYAGFRLDDFAVTQDPSNTAQSPVIASFSPPAGNPGDSIVVLGSGFTGATAVRFNGLASTYTVISDSQIDTIVPKSDNDGFNSVMTGPIFVNTTVGSTASSAPFQVMRPFIASFSPLSATRGTTVIFAGSGFAGTTAVQFTGLSGYVSAEFSVLSDSQAIAVIPADAISPRANNAETEVFGTSPLQWA